MKHERLIISAVDICRYHLANIVNARDDHERLKYAFLLKFQLDKIQCQYRPLPKPIEHDIQPGEWALKNYDAQDRRGAAGN